MGGTNNDGGNSIALDGLNNIYITGYTSSSNYPVVNPLPGFGVKHPFQDAFITEINQNLTSINFSTFLGGNLDDTGTGIAVSDPANIFISGFTTSYDFPTSTNNPTVNSFKVTNKFNGNQYGGWVDGFVTHINNVPTPAYRLRTSPTLFRHPGAACQYLSVSPIHPPVARRPGSGISGTAPRMRQVKTQPIRIPTAAPSRSPLPYRIRLAQVPHRR